MRKNKVKVERKEDLGRKMRGRKRRMSCKNEIRWPTMEIQTWKAGTLQVKCKVVPMLFN